MTSVIIRKGKRQARRLRVRKKVFGASARPRLSVFRSNRYIYGSIIDDVSGRILADVSADVKSLHEGKTKVEAAREVGKLLAATAKKAKIGKVVFDRGGYRYHGRVKSLAEGVREGGLNF
ncbi:50S ribosomal protein L18 [candidate division WWE3 bacterium]|nr:50S ribosomal protein L18 [candidate division WWE3 bacterium]